MTEQGIYVMSEERSGAASNAGPQLFYQEIVAQDKNPPPEDIRKVSGDKIGIEGIDKQRYISPDFHRLEVERMWSRVWQIACREEEIPEVGDVVVYEIADHSLLITRVTESEIKAYYNSCLHRGRKLCSGNTSVEHFRCPFHGFTWALDGSLKEVPCKWDFPQVSADSHRLPEAKVGTWGGFVFINMDPDCIPLEEYLEDLPDQLKVNRFENQYIHKRSRHVLPVNWKIAMESFIEGYHVAETHHHTWKYQGEIAQCDVSPRWKHMNRSFQPIGVQAIDGHEKISEQEILDAWHFEAMGSKGPELPPGIRARSFIANWVRKQKEKGSGQDYSHVSDAEMIDVLQYLLFPNIVLFRGFSLPTVFRFRPNKNDPDSCIFDLYVMREVPQGKERPETAEIVEMGTMRYQDAGVLPKYLGPIYDQDIDNIYNMQEGIKASRQQHLMLSETQEVRIRHFHQTLTEYVERE